jgi:transcription initiation factor TFIID subunit 12
MNNGAQAGQAAQGQPSGAQQQQKRPQMRMFKPEEMRQLPDQFSQQEKEKWEAGLRALWGQMEKHGPETPQHQESRRKLYEFSKTLQAKMHNFRVQQQQAAQQAAQQGTGARPPSQGQPQLQQQQQGGENSGGNPNAAQPQRQPPKISPKLMEHVTNFPYTLPPQLTANSPEAQKWLQDAKQRYLKALIAMEGAAARVSQLELMLKKRQDDGKPLSLEEEKDWQEKKDASSKTHSDAKNFVDNFRAQQSQQRQAANSNANQQGNTGQQQGGGNGNANNGAPAAPARPQMSPQQQAQQQPPNPAAQNTQTVNAAIEAARNQQMAGGRPNMQQNGQMTQPPQMPPQNAPSHPNMPQHQAQTQPQNIKSEAGAPPQINTAATQLQQGQRGSIGNSPQSAVPQSAGPPQSATSQGQGPPRALSHAAALNNAARSYSSGQSSGPNVMGQSHSHPSAPREAQNVITNKMPIPKHLPERAAAPPQPVPINQSRPTYSGGPSNVGNGVLSQPVLARTPAFDMAGEGDNVLSKKKLDELVRQVTGGGQGLEGGESLTPEVESVSILSLLCLSLALCPTSLVLAPSRRLRLRVHLSTLADTCKQSPSSTSQTTSSIRSFKQLARMQRSVAARSLRFAISSSLLSVATTFASQATPVMRSELSARFSLLLLGLPR